MGGRLFVIINLQLLGRFPNILPRFFLSQESNMRRIFFAKSKNLNNFISKLSYKVKISSLELVFCTSLSRLYLVYKLTLNYSFVCVKKELTYGFLNLETLIRKIDKKLYLLLVFRHFYFYDYGQFRFDRI